MYLYKDNTRLLTVYSFKRAIDMCVQVSGIDKVEYTSDTAVSITFAKPIEATLHISVDLNEDKITGAYVSFPPPDNFMPEYLCHLLAFRDTNTYQRPHQTCFKSHNYRGNSENDNRDIC